MKNECKCLSLVTSDSHWHLSSTCECCMEGHAQRKAEVKNISLYFWGNYLKELFSPGLLFRTKSLKMQDYSGSILKPIPYHPEVDKKNKYYGHNMYEEWFWLKIVKWYGWGQ